MKGKIKFIFGLMLTLFLIVTAIMHIESESIWAWLGAFIPLTAFGARMIYGLITGK